VIIYNYNHNIQFVFLLKAVSTPKSNVSLKEALQNPLFKAYQKRQPFDENLRRPCPLIDHPEQLREMIKEPKARSTQLTDSESVDDFVEKMERYAVEWGRVADEIWHKKYKIKTGLS
jgi:hypothetical protein